MRFAWLLWMAGAFSRGVARAEDAARTSVSAFSWDSLMTISGASAATLLIVQGTKRWLDRLIKVPTALYAYIVSVMILLLSTHYAVGLTWENSVLTLLNGYVAASTASHTFDTLLTGRKKTPEKPGE